MNKILFNKYYKIMQYITYLIIQIRRTKQKIILLISENEVYIGKLKYNNMYSFDRITTYF